MNDKYSARLKSITIENFKNVNYGSLSFDNPKWHGTASVMGLYGQNGSGKTALIDAIHLLKYVLSGKSVPNRFVDFIMLGCEKAKFQFDFTLSNKSDEQSVSYSFELGSMMDETQQNMVNTVSSSKNKRVFIENEILKCRTGAAPNFGKIGKLIDTSEAQIFVPEVKKKFLVGKEYDMDLLVAKKMAQTQSRSFLFSAELMKAIHDNYKSNSSLDSSRLELEHYIDMLDELVFYGHNELFIIDTTNSGLVSLNAQPLTFRYKDEEMPAINGSFLLPLNHPIDVPVKEKKVVEKVINNMNIVLEQIVPGLNIGVKNLGKQVLENGTEGYRLQLTSNRNGKEIALKYESEGIKKIVSILQLLIVVYNQRSITVAIDELDSGIFEYLLGELLKIIEEKGKGQLFFTSHNLRPLETLDKGFISFTTTNPNNRYVRLSNIKETNNLRDVYYDRIMLGGNGEKLYEETRNTEIAFAFSEAGRCNGN